MVQPPVTTGYKLGEDDGLPPADYYEERDEPPVTAPVRPMQRKALELGVFEGGSQRWLSLSACSKEALNISVASARAKGWELIPMYEGKDPESGWPCVWMQKPVQDATPPTAQPDSPT